MLVRSEIGSGKVNRGSIARIYEPDGIKRRRAVPFKLKHTERVIVSWADTGRFCSEQFYHTCLCRLLIVACCERRRKKHKEKNAMLFYFYSRRLSAFYITLTHGIAQDLDIRSFNNCFFFIFWKFHIFIYIPIEFRFFIFISLALILRMWKLLAAIRVCQITILYSVSMNIMLYHI